ncbi:MAG: PA2779 family protein [Pseudomonadales bacterium]|nr:PA2779 family protein [Pseudomonadales bacterium]MCP5330379.1 PA2779 family protein [Pseudomonadales bacterium]MCP5344008.1 PA2779 family protein [Pseudomonadales bacterium]
MKINALARRTIGSVLIVALSLMGLQAPAMADIVSTEQLVAEQRADVQRATVNAFLARDEVRAQLEARGVSADDALQRVDSLSNAELAELSQQIDTLPAGEGAIGLVIGILVIFMLLDIAGVTDIFPAI